MAKRLDARASGHTPKAPEMPVLREPKYGNDPYSIYLESFETQQMERAAAAAAAMGVTIHPRRARRSHEVFDRKGERFYLVEATDGRVVYWNVSRQCVQGIQPRVEP